MFGFIGMVGSSVTLSRNIIQPCDVSKLAKTMRDPGNYVNKNQKMFGGKQEVLLGGEMLHRNDLGVEVQF